ncbi:hypothetical protein ACRE_033350 [Hapsidospora chrysogenum ATCC 11550]|uniref:Uncharacterized protein n=1 Tax=Hapsidospora chrysogenum (strain ATCC 11550 / CBS 779.69 / DSM 880 / IAM 14645 / JCM 23072 / IMI 49137) TaxID=857340 RepID=A0A086T901_HAPC1|nr:hypothetical protein ACRE_033350 [Hapsidospora chrysogenum ATCC 11550]
MPASLELDYDRGPPSTSAAGQRQFKKHKPLPRPNSVRGRGPDVSPSKHPKLDLVIDASTSVSGSQISSPRTVKRQPNRVETAFELPPTPPTHSRTSSSTHSVLPSSPTLPEDPVRTPKGAPALPPTTPPDQRSPPTPDVTPPQPASRPKALRPHLGDRGASRIATVESRTDSFRTAREEPFSSEEEDGQSTIRPALASGRTSQATVRKTSDNANGIIPHPKVLDMALARLAAPSEDSYTPRTRGELAQFDGGWGSPGDVELEWDDTLDKTVTVRKRQHGSPMTQSKERKDVVEDTNIVGSNNATKAARQMALSDKASPKSSKSHTSRATRSSSGPSNSDSSVTTSQQRSSGVSSRSVTSTVVEAFLVDTPQKPQRERTLRHVRKHHSLREPVERPVEPVAAPIERGRPSRPPVANTRPERGRHDSYSSTMTVSSVSSGKARREVWKNGGIPVVVVPDRRSSRSRSREPSLRSTSSRRSKRTQSMSSAPLDVSAAKENGPIFERPSRRPRAHSLSDSSDTRTIDFPPAIPVRSSSLSAPTSRNTSRAGSMTADSARARDAVRQHVQPANQELLPAAPSIPDEPQQVKQEQDEPQQDAPRNENPKQLLSPALLSPPQFTSPKPDSESDGRVESDRQDDALSARRFSSRNTPFSVISVETNGTAPEVSEALAVHMYSHQNSSLLMVNHSARPSEVSEIMRQDKELQNVGEQPIITTTGPDGEAPVTPPQPQFSLDDVDSPLRNPRAPPEPPTEPPAIIFTSATPSGVTPTPDRAIALGNYFEAMAEKPARRPSLVHRAFSRHGRHSAPYPPNASRSQGFLKRSFSLTRRRSSSRDRGLSPNRNYPQEDDVPPEENKLHPFWRPQWWEDEDEDEYDNWDKEDRDRPRGRDDLAGEHLRYPLVDNRPPKLKRRFSDKIKRTFAVMPIRDDEVYPADNGNGPERRTIRRTPSGNLRVMRRRNSASSLRRRFTQHGRPYTAPDEESHRGFWRGNSVQKRDRPEGHRRFSLSGPLEEIQRLPRRFSEKRREKRHQELRQKISGPKDVRDGVEDMIRSANLLRESTTQRFV